MKKTKAFLKKWPCLYGLVQNFYYGFRKIIERYLLGTRVQEWLWKRQKREEVQKYLGPGSPPHRQKLLERIENLAPFESVLEIGCATGSNLILLAKKFPNIKIQGIEINPIAVELGNEQFKKEKISNVRLFVGRADDLSQFPDKSFDIVFTGSVLMYIGPDKIKKVVSEMQRIARKAIVVAEYHSDREGALGIYNKGNWLRDYKKLFQPFSSQIEITKISPKGRGEEDWEKLGYVIEVVL